MNIKFKTKKEDETVTITCNIEDKGKEKQMTDPYQGYVICPDVKRFCEFAEVNSCPNECTNNGNCILGTCHCNLGFMGLDCSKSTECSTIGNHPCEEHGTCDEATNTCTCSDGWDGFKCQHSEEIN